MGKTCKPTMNEYATPTARKTPPASSIFREGSDNLILCNLTFKSAGACDTDGWDNLCIDGTTNIWIDHYDFQDGVDGNFDCKNASDNIAVTGWRLSIYNQAFTAIPVSGLLAFFTIML